MNDVFKTSKDKDKKNGISHKLHAVTDLYDELISEKFEIYQQICLVNFIQTIWWRKTKNISLIKKLENLKYLLRKNIQPRLAWEITFLKISIKDI